MTDHVWYKTGDVRWFRHRRVEEFQIDGPVILERREISEPPKDERRAPEEDRT